MERDFTPLMERLDVTFDNVDLLRQALVHRSYLNEHRSFPLDHNERLEFLGDAVLELVVTDYLYKRYENPEGELTSWRAALVNSSMLAKHGDALGFSEFLYTSRGEAKGSDKARYALIANAYEAVIGAIYLDQGYESAAAFITRDLLPEVPHILERRKDIDPKSTFQEMVQEKVSITPQYRVLDSSGPDHQKHFLVGAFIEEVKVAQGEGASKQAAQVEAARAALDEDAWIHAWKEAGKSIAP